MNQKMLSSQILVIAGDQAVFPNAKQLDDQTSTV